MALSGVCATKIMWVHVLSRIRRTSSIDIQLKRGSCFGKSNDKAFAPTVFINFFSFYYFL